MKWNGTLGNVYDVSPFIFNRKYLSYALLGKALNYRSGLLIYTFYWFSFTWVIRCIFVNKIYKQQWIKRIVEASPESTFQPKCEFRIANIQFKRKQFLEKWTLYGSANMKVVSQKTISVCGYRSHSQVLACFQNTQRILQLICVYTQGWINLWELPVCKEQNHLVFHIPLKGVKFR